MKVNVTQEIKDLDGNSLPDKATLRRACLQVLLNTLEGDERMPGDEKAKLFSLAMTIHNNDEPDLSVDDWAKIKGRVGKGYAPLVVGRVFEMIEAGHKAE